MKFVIAVLLGLTPVLWAGEETAPIRYTADFDHFSSERGGYLLCLNLRKNGDPYTVWQVKVDESSPYFARFQSDMARLATEQVYYEIILRKEVPRARGIAPFNLGVVTKQTLNDIAQNSAARAAWDDPAPRATDIISIRPITQNEFLGINPRIVKP